MSDYYDTTVYLVLSLDGRTSYHWTNLNAPKMRMNKPSLKSGEVAVKLEIRVPKSLFKTFIPSGTLTIPTDMALSAPVTVEVPDEIDVPNDVRFKLVPITQEEDDHHE